jgi:hypothetical protein
MPENSAPDETGVRLAELIAPFSLAIDLDIGQPMEHALGACGGLMLVSYDGTVGIAGVVVPEHIEITYQPVDGLPIRVVHVVNGREVQRREVIELRVST